jgi:hypothetical protein
MSDCHEYAAAHIQKILAVKKFLKFFLEQLEKSQGELIHTKRRLTQLEDRQAAVEKNAMNTFDEKAVGNVKTEVISIK